jgi:uncharacterized protein (DUF1684 family)
VNEPTATLSLLDYRRRVQAIYAAVRAEPDPELGWHRWRAARDELFARHPQSPLDEDQRDTFAGLEYYPYEPRWRVLADVEPSAQEQIGVGHSAGESTTFRRFGVARFLSPDGAELELSLYWLTGYGGGVFLPFRDATSGPETYGGGRYLLDTAKGADLGSAGERLILDFNYAYHPSCVHHARWSCPLAPRENWLGVAIEAGERS